MEKSTGPQEIASQQVLVDETSIYSTQWMVIPERFSSVVTPGYLLDRYFNHLTKVTLSLVHPTRTAEGIEFRLAGTRFSILSFSLPEESTGGQALNLAISGGFLVQPGQCQRGQFSFIAEPQAEGELVMLRLSDYCPLLLGGQRPSALRRWLYRVTQAWIHKKVTLSFLARVYRELAGHNAPVTTIRVTPQTGRET